MELSSITKGRILKLIAKVIAEGKTIDEVRYSYKKYMVAILPDKYIVYYGKQIREVARYG